MRVRWWGRGEEEVRMVVGGGMRWMRWEAGLRMDNTFYLFVYNPRTAEGHYSGRTRALAHCGRPL